MKHGKILVVDDNQGIRQQMQEIRHSLEKISPTDATVLITGENGTGKDMLAREIHALSSRRHHPIIATSFEIDST